MKILIDTNILVSAALNPQSIPMQAILKSVTSGQIVVCQKNLDELNKTFLKKFLSRMKDMLEFKVFLLARAEIIPTPAKIFSIENSIRDVNDRSILRAAVSANVDIIISGDKDFLESGIDKPKILTARDFIDQFVDENN